MAFLLSGLGTAGWQWGLRQSQVPEVRGHGPPGWPPTSISCPQVESNFGRCHQFLVQASIYLRSPHKNLKLTAMKFIGRGSPAALLPPMGPVRLHALPGGRPTGWTTGSISQALVSCRLPAPSSRAGGILQDYFTNLCFYLKKGDVKFFRKRECTAVLHPHGWPQVPVRPLLGCSGHAVRPGLCCRVRGPQAGAGLHLPQVLQELPGRRHGAVPVLGPVSRSPRAGVCRVCDSLY